MREQAKSDKGMATTARSNAGQTKTSQVRNTRASFAGARFTGRNGKSATGGLSFARLVAAGLLAAGCNTTATANSLSHGSAKHGLLMNAQNVAQPSALNSIILSRDLLAAGRIKTTRKLCAKHATCANITTKICRTTHGSKCILSTQDVFKPSLIDLEAQEWATGRKQAKAVQRERLSERARYENNVMRQSEPSYNFRRSEGGRLEAVAPP
ncbi:MAG: hypothetical protein NUV74_04400, partial [Candidatus Brocadiaceae bacterium]|nr:hypothetical protein [Candidatus Brocadiaceae bacterium]